MELRSQLASITDIFGARFTSNITPAPTCEYSPTTGVLFTLLAAWPHGSRVCGIAAARTSVLRLSGASAAGRLQTDIALTSFPTLFTELLPLPPLAPGVCVAVALPDESDIAAASAARGRGDGAAPSLSWSALGVPTAGLHAEEVERLGSLRTVGRQLEYAGGRVALRRALFLSGWRGADALLANEVGAVRMPRQVGSRSGALLLGSISHTRGVAVAIVGGCDDLGDELSAGGGGATSAGEPGGGEGGRRSGLVRTPSAAVGVDIESKSRRSVARMARRILADEERATLEARASGLAMDAETELILRFSIKEALYKALHPLLRASVPWHSVRVLPLPDGTVAVDTSDPSFGRIVDDGRGALQAQACWVEKDGFFLTSAAAWREG